MDDYFHLFLQILFNGELLPFQDNSSFIYALFTRLSMIRKAYDNEVGYMFRTLEFHQNYWTHWRPNFRVGIPSPIILIKLPVVLQEKLLHYAWPLCFHHTWDTTRTSVKRWYNTLLTLSSYFPFALFCLLSPSAIFLNLPIYTTK